MTTAFKFFNVIQIILVALLMIGALITVVSSVAVLFNLDFLAPIFQIEIIAAIPLAYGAGTVSYIASLVGLSSDIAGYISIAVSVLAFVFLLVLFIRMCRPSKFYTSFRGFTFAIIVIFALIMGFNGYLISEIAFTGEIVGIIPFALDVIFVVLAIYFLIMNLRGKKLLGDEPVNPDDFFGSNQTSFGVARPTYSMPPQHPNTPPSPPARRAPPPPPPPRR